MNRTPRRGRAPPPGSPATRHHDSLNRFKPGVRTKGSTGIEVLHAPGKMPGRKSRTMEKNVANRCCYVSPDKKNFGQYYVGDDGGKPGSKEKATGPERPIKRESLDLLKSLSDFKSGISANTLLPGQKKLSRHSRNKMKASMKCGSNGSCNTPMFTAFDESRWQKIDSPQDLDNIIKSRDVPGFELPKLSSQQIYISEVPRVKVIAEKFSKYKQGNLELRRLDEKVVCVEYDIFNQPHNHEVLKPVQKMRAFFSIKPFDKEGTAKQGLPKLPSNIKNELEVEEGDLEKFTEKEIEFIDNEVEENQRYLEDLRRILKRKEQTNAHKNKNSLDLQCLYEMAKRDGRPLNSELSETNLLSKAKLQEVKQLILQRCTSSIHGFKRKTIKKSGATLEPATIFEGIMSDMIQHKS